MFTVVLVAGLVTPDDFHSNLRTQPTIYILSSTKQIFDQFYDILQIQLNIYL